MPDMSLGDAAQIRRIVEQVLSAEEDIGGERLDKKIDARVADRIAATEAKFNKRLLTLIVANIVPLIIIAFCAGGLWIKFQDVPDVLKGRAKWMRNTEVRLKSLEEHHQHTDGYLPPDTIDVPD